MRGISFEYSSPVSTLDINRMDVACFIGFVSPKLPKAELKEDSEHYIEKIMNRPISIESWEDFQYYFDVHRSIINNKYRGYDSSESVNKDSDIVDSYLGAAVRAFFRQGGRKCYAIAVASSNFPYFENESYNDRIEKISLLNIGLKHIIDLNDITYLCFPDLVEIFKVDTKEITKMPEETKEEIFVHCSQNNTQKNAWSYVQPYSAPVYSQNSYYKWKEFINETLKFLKKNGPTIQLVASLPLPDTETQKQFESFILNTLLPVNKDDLYCRLQLVFPWLKTEQSKRLPE